MKKKAVVERGICVACGACVKGCPRKAISIWCGCYAQVDEERCVGCGICIRTCPVGCISSAERSEGV